MAFPPLPSIAKRRKALGKTQVELAKLCDVGQSFIAKIERGEAMPSYAIAVKLFETLDRLESKHSESISDLHAGDVMVKKVITVTPADRAEHARKIMLEKNISQLPVVDNDGGRTGPPLSIGSITERTLLGIDSVGKTVREVMDQEVFPSVPVNAKLSLVISILREGEQSAVLVTEKGKIAGIITKHDLLSSHIKKNNKTKVT